MTKMSPINMRIWSKLGQRGTFGVAISEIAKKNENLMVLTADLTTTSGLERLSHAHPDKFLNVGIAESNMVGMAAGLAREDYVVFATTFATFATMRSYEQVRINLGYMRLNVKLVGLGSGFAMGMFGNTHYGIEDIALMRALPNMTVLSPADGAEVVKCVHAAAHYHGPVYLRLTGAMNNPIVYRDDYPFEIGKAVRLREGSDLTVIATGSMVHAALEAAKLLEQQSISTAVVNMHTLKPLDTTVIDESLDKKLIVTVEEHSIVGGLGAAVAEYTATLARRPPQVFVGISDAFPKPGSYQYLLEHSNLTAPQIADTIIDSLNQYSLKYAK